jgi:phosphonoacetate hydrolase
MRAIQIMGMSFCLTAFSLFPTISRAADEPPRANAPTVIKPDQRVLIAMVDGLGTDYVAASEMPNLKSMMAEGIAKSVKAVMPTVTNVNNASICCGAWPNEHGITGNSFFDFSSGRPEYMESAEYLRIPTLFERAERAGVRSALLTAKKKTVALLSRGTELAIAAEAPSAEMVSRYGQAPPIYSREINYWLWEVAIDLLKNRPDLKVLYVHTTDYPMHMWPPEAPESKEHLARLDALLGKAVAAAPDCAFLLTADHGLNAKSRCWDLEKACKNRGVVLRFALSVERDKYVKHHRTFGGTAWVGLNSPSDAAKVTEVIRGLKGVEEVLTRDDAVNRFHLMASRIGDLVVLGDKDTVFGELEAESEELPATFRTHGSLHESDVPLVIYNARGELPKADELRNNFDLTRHLFRSPR